MLRRGGQMRHKARTTAATQGNQAPKSGTSGAGGYRASTDGGAQGAKKNGEWEGGWKPKQKKKRPTKEIVPMPSLLPDFY